MEESSTALQNWGTQSETHGTLLLAKESWEGSQRPAPQLALPVQSAQGSQQYPGQGHPVAGHTQAAHILAHKSVLYQNDIIWQVNYCSLLWKKKIKIIN